MKTISRLALAILLVIMLFAAVLPVSAQAPVPASASGEVLQEPTANIPQLVVILLEVSIWSVVVFAAVAWLKSMGLRGKYLTGAAFVFGLIIGMCYRYSLNPFTNFGDWFWAVVFGLMLGFVATGAYKGVESATQPRYQDLIVGEPLDYSPEPQR